MTAKGGNPASPLWQADRELHRSIQGTCTSPPSGKRADVGGAVLLRERHGGQRGRGEHHDRKEELYC